MRIFFDTEFIDTGRIIDLISIGLVREDGMTLYEESLEFDSFLLTPWLEKNVIPHLRGNATTLDNISHRIREFVGETPEFWAYYAAYDWVALCQLYGTMMDLPHGWPKYCRDIKQLCDSIGNPQLPPIPENQHHALADAQWNRQAFEFLIAKGAQS